MAGEKSRYMRAGDPSPAAAGRNVQNARQEKSQQHPLETVSALGRRGTTPKKLLHL